MSAMWDMEETKKSEIMGHDSYCRTKHSLAEDNVWVFDVTETNKMHFLVYDG